MRVFVLLLGFVSLVLPSALAGCFAWLATGSVLVALVAAALALGLLSWLARD